jgi:hypothetical protein
VDIVSAAATGDRRATLIALRDAIARTIQSCESGRDMAALSKRLIEVMDELDAISSSDDEPSAFDSVLDEL